MLVPGAWQGGWVWQRVVAPLRQAGHEVYTPTLTGVGDRAHLLSPSVGLSTHITDVVALVEAYDLDDVVLVAHSYAGLVVTGVADRIPERVAKCVYLDAFIGADGDAAIDLLPEKVAAVYRQSVASAGFGWMLPVRTSLSAYAVTQQADLDFLTPRLTPHPWLSFTERLRLGCAAKQVPGAFIECINWSRAFEPQAERAVAFGWPVHQIAAGHQAMVTAPELVAKLLADVSSSSRVSVVI